MRSAASSVDYGAWVYQPRHVASAAVLTSQDDFRHRPTNRANLSLAWLFRSHGLYIEARILQRCVPTGVPRSTDARIDPFRLQAGHLTMNDDEHLEVFTNPPVFSIGF